jgi:uncharacterized protein YaeQ
MISVNKTHRFCRTPYGFQMSPYLQELTVLTGQQCVFEDGSEQLEKLAGVEITAKQIERLTHAYGELLEARTLETPEVVAKEPSMQYCMMDGGMILTREDDWKELKLARVFPGKAHMAESEKRNFIKESSYVAHLGGHHPFFRKLEGLTDRLGNMVWICDGARWIWNWIEANHPESRQILDYYHCTEKLHDFAREAFKKGIERRRLWTDRQEELLKNGEVRKVLANISLVCCKGRAVQKQRSLQTYYENNIERMDYKKYREDGLLIGSGPMEAAHRNVIQSRMKLSGQRWTIKGAQQVANLRVANKSGDWQNVLNLINLN